MSGQASVKLISECGQKINCEIFLLVVLITNRVEEGSLGMVTTFCCHDQSKVETSEVLSTLHQQNSPKWSVVVVKVFANFPYPLGSSSFIYLDVTTLSSGGLTAQFPLDQPCL